MDGSTSVSGSGKATRDVRLVFMMPTFHQSPFKILDRSLPCCNFRLPMPNQCVVRNRPVLLTSDFSQVDCDHAPQTCDPCSQFLITPHASPSIGIDNRTADYHNLSILYSLTDWKGDSPLPRGCPFLYFESLLVFVKNRRRLSHLYRIMGLEQLEFFKLARCLIRWSRVIG